MTRTDAQHDGVHALLSDGETVIIRPARRADYDGLLRLYHGMSQENLRLRFFGVTRRLAHAAAAWVLAPPRPGHGGLVAVHGERIIGIAEYEVTTGSDTAEISLAVADDYHRRGVGTLLVEHLAHAARGAGISTFTADTLAANHLMQRLVADLGAAVERHHEDGEVRICFPLVPDERYREAVDRRGRTADLASLRPLLRPRSVAVIGAGRSAASAGRAVLRKILDGDFPGRVYAVNPHAHAILRTPCYPSVLDLPQPPDLAVIAVRAAAVPETAEQCGAAGVRALVVLSAGLDAGQGAALLASCRRHDMRLVGPNCLGIAVTEEHTRLDATFAARRPLPGNAGVAVQSGGVGIALIDGLTRLGIGVSEFVSLGDKYDVSGNDMLQFWEADGGTSIALMHLESFGNPRAFSRTARRVARRMPLLTVDAGRSPEGRRAAASHTAAAATPTMTRQALFSQAGITATRSLAELLDTAALLSVQPLPAGDKVAVVSNAGGVGVLAADACIEAGLHVPQLPAALVTDLLAVLPEGAEAKNPVDATAAVGEAALSDCIDRLARHEAVDAILVALAPTALTAATGDDPQRALTGASIGISARTTAAVVPGQAEQVRVLRGRGGTALPAYADPRAAARALAHAAGRSRWLARPPGSVPSTPGTDPGAARALAGRYLAEHPDGGWLDPQTCTELLAHYGIPHLPTTVALCEEQAVQAARDLTGGSGRIAMKAYWPGLVHKSEQNAVLLDVDGEDEVRTAHRELSARFPDRLAGVVIQPMARRGTELVAGMVQDPVFGPLVLFGLGGTATDVLADHAARLAPLTDNDVNDLLTTPRCSQLLFGRGGEDRVAVGGLEQVLSRLSTMACDLPQLVEADINPLLARRDSVVAVDVRVRVLPQHAHDPYLRRLR